MNFQSFCGSSSSSNELFSARRLSSRSEVLGELSGVSVVELKSREDVEVDTVRIFGLESEQFRIGSDDPN